MSNDEMGDADETAEAEGASGGEDRRIWPFVTAEQAVIIVDDEGYKEALTKQRYTEKFRAFSEVYRAEDNPIRILVRNPKSGEREERDLLDQKTGVISLKRYTFAPYVFRASTSEGKTFLVDARVSFRLDHTRLHTTFRVDDFGEDFALRIQKFFRDAIAQYKDQELMAHRRDITRQVMADLAECEKNSDAKDAVGQALGIEPFLITFDAARPSTLAGRAMSRYMAPADQVAQDMAAEGAEGGQEYAGPGEPRTAAQFTLGHYDDIADVFRYGERETRPYHPRIVNAVLEVMRMHTQQRIAEAIASSKNKVMVLSTDDLGLGGSMTLRSSMQEFLKAKASGARDAADPTQDVSASALQAEEGEERAAIEEFQLSQRRIDELHEMAGEDGEEPIVSEAAPASAPTSEPDEKERSGLFPWSKKD